MGGNKKEKGSAAVEAAAPSPPAPPAPPAPEMPKIGISQLLPMVLLLGMNKFDPEKMGYQRHIEIGYVVVQIVCLAVLGLLYTKITAMPEDNTMIPIKEVKQFGTVVKPATEMTAKEYDIGNWKEQLQKLVMGAVILGCIYAQWGYLTPLVLQLFMTPAQLIESELFSIHIRGKDVARPFPAANPFGLPQMPQAPEPEPEPELDDKPSQSSEKTLRHTEDDSASTSDTKKVK